MLLDHNDEIELVYQPSLPKSLSTSLESIGSEHAATASASRVER